MYIHFRLLHIFCLQNFNLFSFSVCLLLLLHVRVYYHHHHHRMHSQKYILMKKKEREHQINVRQIKKCENVLLLDLIVEVSLQKLRRALHDDCESM